MSGARKTFCTVVRSGAGGSSKPRKNGISGCIPAETSSVERSSARGISGAEGRNVCPFDSKKARKPARSSAEVCMARFYGRLADGLMGREDRAVPPDAKRLRERRHRHERLECVPACRETAHRLV